MASQPSEYLRTKVLTASAEELHLMLYEGAIRFASQAREHLAGGRIEDAYHLLIKAQRIVMEMTTGLRHEVNPEMCGRLASLYNFVHRKLVEANLTRRTEPIDDAIKILSYDRDTWVMVVDKIKAEKAAGQNAGPAPAEPPALNPPASVPVRPPVPRRRSAYPTMSGAGETLNIQG